MGAHVHVHYSAWNDSLTVPVRRGITAQQFAWELRSRPGVKRALRHHLVVREPTGIFRRLSDDELVECLDGAEVVLIPEV